jgi:hypothetical protein
VPMLPFSKAPLPASAAPLCFAAPGSGFTSHCRCEGVRRHCRFRRPCRETCVRLGRCSLYRLVGIRPPVGIDRARTTEPWFRVIDREMVCQVVSRWSASASKKQGVCDRKRGRGDFRSRMIRHQIGRVFLNLCHRTTRDPS